MTEEEWLECDDPARMLEQLREKGLSDRKLRLFACGCCRRIWKLLPNDTARRFIELMEQWADSVERRWDKKTGDCIYERHEIEQQQGTLQVELKYHAAWDKIPGYEHSVFPSSLGAAEYAGEIWPADPDTHWTAAWGASHHCSHAAGYVHDSFDEREKHRKAESQAQAKLLRCIAGNPFCAVILDHESISATAKLLAARIYQERAFDLLPILADSLEEGGCQQEDVLRHLRDGGEHFRGCWALDQVREATEDEEGDFDYDDSDYGDS